MRKLWILFKTDIINSFGINKLKKKFAERSQFLRIWLPLLTLLIALLFFGFALFYMILYSSLFAAVGELEGILIFGIGAAALIAFITSLTKAHAYLYDCKDYDLLMSFPIPPRTIIFSKLTNLLFLNYVYFGFIYFPTIIAYGIFAHPAFWFYLVAVALFFIAPIPVVTVSSLLSFLVNSLTSKMKHKNIFKTLGMLVVFLVVMISIFSFQLGFASIEGDETAQLLQMVQGIKTTFKTIYPLGEWLAQAMHGNLMYILAYLGVAVVPFGLFIMLVERNFVRANNYFRVSYTDKHFKLQAQNASTPFWSLIKREIRRYFSSSMVVLNTIVGPIMSTIFVLILLFGKDTMLMEMELTGLQPDTFALILIVMSSFMLGLISTTATSISLEGKTFWIIKSAPLSEASVFWSKIGLNFIIALPFLLINTVAVAIAVQPNPIYVVLMFFIPAMINIANGQLSLYINLLLPRMEWDSEVRIVKQSMSVIVAMLLGMSLFGILIALYFVLSFLGALFALLIVFTILALIIVLFTALLATDGAKRYRKIKA